MPVKPVQVLDKVFELASRVGDLMHAALTERGLTPARAEVLLVLHTQARPMVQRELSQSLQCTPRHVTALVDALEGDGWVTRGRHPTDRRATLVALTQAGTDAADRMTAERAAAAGALFDGLPAADLAAFVSVADHVLTALTAHAEPREHPAQVPRGLTGPGPRT